MLKTFAKILLVNERGQFLYLRRSETDDHRPGGPDFPGGTVEPDEDPTAGLIRETLEETGLAVHDAQLVYAVQRIGGYGTGALLIYTARVPNDSVVRLSDEHSAYQWLTPQQALDTSGYAGHEEILQFIIAHNVLAPTTPKTVTCRMLLVNPAGELLILRRSATDPFHGGAWDLPGGRAEPGESFVQTAVRETNEECGLDVLDPILVFGTSNPRREGTGTWLFYHKLVPKETVITVGDEHDQYQWIPAADLPTYTDYDVLLRMHEFAMTYRLYNGRDDDAGA